MKEDKAASASLEIEAQEVRIAEAQRRPAGSCGCCYPCLLRRAALRNIDFYKSHAYQKTIVFKNWSSFVVKLGEEVPITIFWLRWPSLPNNLASRNGGEV